MKHNIKNIIVLSVALVVSVSLFAQEDDGLINTPAAYEQMKIRNQWYNTTNPAGLLLDRPKNYTELNVGYELYTGKGKSGRHKQLSFMTDYYGLNLLLSLGYNLCHVSHYSFQPEWNVSSVIQLLFDHLSSNLHNHSCKESRHCSKPRICVQY